MLSALLGTSMVFFFFLPALRSISLRVRGGQSQLPMNAIRSMLPPHSHRDYSSEGNEVHFSFSWSDDKKDCHLGEWRQCNCLPPSHVLSQYVVKNVSTVDFIWQRDILPPDCSSHSCILLKLFFNKKQEKKPFFCSVGYPKEVLQFTAWYPVLFPLLLFFLSSLHSFSS